ncbi:MAG: VOC family protein, partial [Actinomycetota bacterium]|nr:VOC family protein [Actinomycetota bacterium]
RGAPIPANEIHDVELTVTDVGRSLAFYNAVLGPLGLEEHERYPSYGGTEELVYLRSAGRCSVCVGRRAAPLVGGRTRPHRRS